MHKKGFIITEILILIALLGAVGFAIFNTVDKEEIILGAPVSNHLRNVLPIADKTYDLGSTTPALEWNGIYTKDLFISGTCTGCGAGGGASVFGDLTDVATSSDATGDVYYLNSSGQITNLNVGANGEVLTLAAGLPSWAAGGGGGSTLHVDGFGFVYPLDGDFHSAPYYEATSTTPSLFAGGFVTQASSTIDGTLTVTGLTTFDAGFISLASSTITATTTILGNSVDSSTDLSGNTYDLHILSSSNASSSVLKYGQNRLDGTLSGSLGNIDFTDTGYIKMINVPGSETYFVFLNTDNEVRFALAEPGIDKATYSPRSMIVAGPWVDDVDYIKCSFWGFWAIDCDTGGTGADLGVQDDLQVLGDIYTGGTITASTTLTIEDLTNEGLLTNSTSGVISSTSTISQNFIDSAIARDTELHNAVTLAGENYLSLATQQITANAIDLATSNVTGVLPDANVANDITIDLAGTVTTNANLTGHITSTGNATILGAFTEAQLETAVSDDNPVFDGDIGSNVQAWDAVLDDLSALTVIGNNEFLVGTGAGVYANESGATVRTSLGLGTAAVVATDLGDLNEATIEAAIDTLANLTSIQNLTVTFADAAADAIWGWDDTASAYENLTQAEVLAIIGSASLTAEGVIEIATVTETNTGTDATRAVSPDGLDGWIGSARITILGTIATGVWEGTTIAVNQGGTGATSLDDILGTSNEIDVANGANTIIGGNSTLSISATLDLGGNTSFEIPNGTNPTVNAIGELAFDTTDNQLLIGDSGGTARVIGRVVDKIWSVTISSTTPEFVSGGLLAIPPDLDGYTIVDIRCKTDGTGSPTKIIAIEDASGNSTEDITCAETVTADDGSITNATYTAEEESYIDFGASGGTQVNTVSISIFGFITRE